LVERCRSVSCSQARRELLEHFALGEELGSRSGPHLAHLQSCAECRQEIGLNRELVANLRRALRDRVQGSSPSDASWELIRRRAVDRPMVPWTVRVVRWGGMASAAAAAVIMMFAVVTAPESRLPGGQSLFVASAPRRAVPPLDEASWPAAQLSTDVAPQRFPPLPGWPRQTQLLDEAGRRDGEPPITGHMR
jgi:anti-sigma factor RsiW